MSHHPLSSEQRIIAILDPHLHLYTLPSAAMIIHLRNKLVSQAAPEHPQWVGAVLTERDHENYYVKFFADTIPGEKEHFSVERVEAFIKITFFSGGCPLYLFPGSQHQTAEGVELHALGRRVSFDHPPSLLEGLHKIHSVGAVGALPFGFGKWLFGRGKAVQKFLDTLPADQKEYLMISDSRLRPTICAVGTMPLEITPPPTMPILYGSDPLSLGEDRLEYGAFATRLEVATTIADLPHHLPLRKVFSATISYRAVGRRLTFLGALSRSLALKLAK